MSKQAAEPECCPSLVVASLTGERAAGLARMFKALGDPVRLRQLSTLLEIGVSA